MYIKTGKPLAHCKRLSHNYGTNIALLGTMQILLFGAGYKYSYFLTYLVEYSIRYSTEYSSSKKLDSHTTTHKSAFGVHYRTGSPGQLGLRVAGFPGHWIWVTKCDPVLCLAFTAMFTRKFACIGLSRFRSLVLRTSFDPAWKDLSKSHHQYYDQTTCIHLLSVCIQRFNTKCRLLLLLPRQR